LKIGLFLGLTTVDLLFALPVYPIEDSKSVASEFLAAAGGPATNAAVVFAALGGQARLVSSLPDEGVGNIARADLRAHGVEHHPLRMDQPAPEVLSAIAVSGANGSRTILTTPSLHSDAPLALNAGRLPELIVGCDVLMLDGHQVTLAAEAARLARAGNVPVVLDGDIYRAGVEELLPLVDAVIFGKTFEMPGCAGPQAIIDRMLSAGARHVAATQGGDPILFASEGRAGTIPVAAVTCLDTLAAGDFFHGAFCFDFCVSGDFETALRFASRIATRSVETWGPREWLKSL
jgi:sugar/nucleoside kinase (ribokinase family)